MGRAIALILAFAVCCGDARSQTTDSLHFDLICHERGRVVADPHPDHTGTYPANVRRWRVTSRYAVDLQAMRFCEVSECARLGPRPIASLDAEQIVFLDAPGLIWRVRRADGDSRQEMIDGERVSVKTGYCRRASFSGFPPTAVG